jgi:hypothetical protein
MNYNSITDLAVGSNAHMRINNNVMPAKQSSIDLRAGM